jgi:hypothetical protein
MRIEEVRIGELASRSGLSKTAVSLWRAGKYCGSAEVAEILRRTEIEIQRERMIERYGVDIEQLPDDVRRAVML